MMRGMLLDERRQHEDDGTHVYLVHVMAPTCIWKLEYSFIIKLYGILFCT